MKRLMRPAALAATLAALILSGMTVPTPHTAHAVDSIALTPVFSNLARPTSLTHAGDGSNRIFITQADGQILVSSGGTPTTFLDISGLVRCCGEEGLLSVAFHPDYGINNNGFFYVNYTDNNGDSVIARYEASPPSSNTANPGSGVILLTIPHPGSTNHNGGQLHFGPNDGYLYFAIGDATSQNNAPNINTLLGKLLRLDVDAAAPYIAAGNPYAGATPGLDEIWAIGFRNPWRFSFDRANGDLYIADVGQNQWEEVNYTAAATAPPLNYGWPTMEARHCFSPPSGCNMSGLTQPPLEYSHADGNCSVTGGYVYRGSVYPELVGQYIYGDFCSGRIWAARPSGGGAFTFDQILDAPHQISSFGEDEAGELYVVSIGSTPTNGVAYRIDASLMADSDDDGCSDAEELGPTPALGGQRDRFNGWDFYDVNGNSRIDAVDIALVRANFNGSGPTPPEDLIYDRRNSMQVWAPGPPNNAINAVDIALARASFNHTCDAFP
jgi:glucose/arabinose dehydrogenase